MSIIRVDAHGPFHHRAALAMLAAHAIPGAEELDGTTYRRILTIDGEPALVTITLDPGGLTAVTDPSVDDPAPVAALIRRWFDLDTDTALVDRKLAADPVLAPLIARRPGLRLIGYPDEFEAVAAAVIGQQVSLAAARTFASRLVTAYGNRYAELGAFPVAAALARLGPAEIQQCAGLTRARARTLHEVSRLWAQGTLLHGVPAADARRLLLDIPGIGPWTADYLLVRALHDPDTFAPGDLVARRALGLDRKAAAARSPAWAPYRSYALLHLWTDAAYR
ncbi:DNA-3-methyladenine glycosylase family protein [Skermania piniformis]|uniref:DNA-3-methyladenine glycosylase II n=1 Tax=Skermania pinensis TaxID=39122 RepID=A0ABX8S7X8_9ACTN|nr:AlkA N-terminal domain-containing protein [Skermania piniformis]QXQ13919.1 DNA-3-methyladenine glycosylase [Skermania piniformis]